MKKNIIHSIPVVTSFIWLALTKSTFNPISLKGPDFLNFYFILLFGFYASIFVLKFFEEAISKTTFYYLMPIFVLGIIKLIRGLYLGKPIGYLLIILILEIAVFIIIKSFQFNQKLK